MKFLMIALLLLPFITIAQTKQDYEKAMAAFVKYYNNQQSDSICTANFSDAANCFWAKIRPERIYKEYGRIIEFKYLGIAEKDPENVTVFKVNFERKGVKAMSFNLNEENKFLTFRFDTIDDEIEDMLRAQ